MMASNIKQSISRLIPSLGPKIAQVRREVFGHLPQLNQRTGHQMTKQQLKGVYWNQYYMDGIEISARKVIPGFMNDQEERRHIKLIQLRRRGAGPPKKGSGSRKKKR